MIRAPIFYAPKVLGFAPYRPQAEAGRIIEQVKEVLLQYASYLPLTLRQVYYRLIATHEEHPKTEVFYDRLGTILARSRRAGLISFDAIRDDGTQTLRCGDGFNGPASFFRSVLAGARGYSRNKRLDQSRQVILMCETAGMVPQILSAVGDLPVIVQTSGGMDSVTAKYDLANLCSDKDTTILHVGDWDPGGIAIYHGIALDVGQMHREIAEAGHVQPFAFDFDRIAVTPEQVAEYGLLTANRKSGDADKRWFPGIGGDPDLTCQAEALPPDALARIVREAVEAEIDMETYRQACDLEQVERLQITTQIEEAIPTR